MYSNDIFSLRCIELIEDELRLSNRAEATQNLLTDLTLSQLSGDEIELEFKRGRDRVKYMYIYELTRYAILSSERDKQEKALEVLKKTEEFYHENGTTENLPPPEPNSLLGMLDSLNAESSKDMFTYVLFYLGQVCSKT